MNNHTKRKTGPKTSEGKKAVSQNAIKHGLTSSQVVLPNENMEDFLEHKKKMLEDLSPVGYREELIADLIIESLWRLDRVKRYERDAFIFAENKAKFDSIIDEIKGFAKENLDTDFFCLTGEQEEKTKALKRKGSRLLKKIREQNTLPGQLIIQLDEKDFLTIVARYESHIFKIYQKQCNHLYFLQKSRKKQ